jgi:hypothetical protein
MKTDQKVFLLELSSLMKKYRATMQYTNNDDGIHISVDGQEVFVGFLFDDDASENLYQNVIKRGITK